MDAVKFIKERNRMCKSFGGSKDYADAALHLRHEPNYVCEPILEYSMNKNKE